jgi:hypothetical protein
VLTLSFLDHTQSWVLQFSSGNSILFRSDNWTPEILFNKFPRLHSFAIDKLASVKDILLLADSIDVFRFPLSTQAFDEFHEFRH